MSLKRKVGNRSEFFKLLVLSSLLVLIIGGVKLVSQFWSKASQNLDQQEYVYTGLTYPNPPLNLALDQQLFARTPSRLTLGDDHPLTQTTYQKAHLKELELGAQYNKINVRDFDGIKPFLVVIAGSPLESDLVAQQRLQYELNVNTQTAVRFFNQITNSQITVHPAEVMVIFSYEHDIPSRCFAMNFIERSDDEECAEIATHIHKNRLMEQADIWLANNNSLPIFLTPYTGLVELKSHFHNTHIAIQPQDFSETSIVGEIENSKEFAIYALVHEIGHSIGLIHSVPISFMGVFAGSLSRMTFFDTDAYPEMYVICASWINTGDKNRCENLYKHAYLGLQKNKTTNLKVSLGCKNADVRTNLPESTALKICKVDPSRKLDSLDCYDLQKIGDQFVLDNAPFDFSGDRYIFFENNKTDLIRYAFFDITGQDLICTEYGAKCYRSDNVLLESAENVNCPSTDNGEIRQLSGYLTCGKDRSSNIGVNHSYFVYVQNFDQAGNEIQEFVRLDENGRFNFNDLRIKTFPSFFLVISHIDVNDLDFFEITKADRAGNVWVRSTFQQDLVSLTEKFDGLNVRLNLPTCSGNYSQEVETVLAGNLICADANSSNYFNNKQVRVKLREISSGFPLGKDLASNKTMAGSQRFELNRRHLVSDAPPTTGVNLPFLRLGEHWLDFEITNGSNPSIPLETKSFRLLMMRNSTLFLSTPDYITNHFSDANNIGVPLACNCELINNQSSCASNPLMIRSFTADKTTLNPGEQTIIRWESNAESCIIKNANRSASMSLYGSDFSLTPRASQDLNITLTCYKQNQQQSRSLAIKVGQTSPSQPPTGADTTIAGTINCQISGNPANIEFIDLYENNGSEPRLVQSASLARVDNGGRYQLRYPIKNQTSGVRYAIRPRKTTSNACIADHTLENAYFLDQNNDGQLETVCSNDGYGQRGCESINQINFGFLTCDRTCENNHQAKCDIFDNQSWITQLPNGELAKPELNVVGDYLQVCVRGEIADETSGFLIYLNREIEFTDSNSTPGHKAAINPDYTTGGKEFAIKKGDKYCTRASASNVPISPEAKAPLAIPLSAVKEGDIIRIFPDIRAGSNRQKISCTSDNVVSASCSKINLSGLDVLFQQGLFPAPDSAGFFFWNNQGAEHLDSLVYSRFNDNNPQIADKIVNLDKHTASFVDEDLPANTNWSFKVEGKTSKNLCAGSSLSTTYAGLTTYHPQGYMTFDKQNCQIKGWARDQDAPNQSIDVHFYLDGKWDDPEATFLGKYQANLPQLDLQYYGHNFIAYGFEVKLDHPRIKDGKSHRLYAYGINKSGTKGTTVQLSSSPLTIKCD